MRKKRHPLYQTWSNMKTRCYNPNSPSFKYYGARGILVDDQWKESFKNFCSWAMENGYKPGLHIERIDNEKGYSPENCTWATPSQQQCNKRKYRSANQYQGISKNRNQWYWRVQVNGKQIRKYGFTSPEEALASRNQFILTNQLPNQIHDHTTNEHYRDTTTGRLDPPG